MTVKIKRFSNTGFIPLYQDFYTKDMVKVNSSINHYGVFAFFDGCECEFLLNHIHPDNRKNLRCFEAIIEGSAEVYNVDELFLEFGISTVDKELNKNVPEIFIPKHSLCQIKNIKEVENILNK